VNEPEGPVRRGFTSALDEIDARVTQLYALVNESLVAATDSFLAADREEARSITRRDARIDELEREIEQTVERTLLFEAPVARDFHRLITALRIVPELERSGDLAEHIASRAATGLGTDLTPVVRGIIEQLGQEVATMWRAAAEAWIDKDASAAERLGQQDEVVNQLHQRLWDELVASDLPAQITMEMALVARFYERLGDHAKHVTERLPAG
jgi:phosphate transport system protein